MKDRKFQQGAWHHIYVITEDGGVLFYRITDRLSFFTVASVFARRYNMIVLGLSIMFTHFHMMLKALDLTQLRSFMQQVLAAFSRIIVEDRTLERPVFKRPFGSAPKVSEKDQRASLIYLYNNPVEKKLCKRAADDRWTFLRYAKDAFPFSSRLVKRKVRFALRTAADVVDREAAAGRYLRPALLRNLFQPLSREEQEQLTDYIIQCYQFICIDEAVGRFDSYESMLDACDASSGKEFDVGEVFDPFSDVPYREMAHMAAQAHLFDNWELLHLGPQSKKRWFQAFRTGCSATERQVRKFMHIGEDESVMGK